MGLRLRTTPGFVISACVFVGYIGGTTACYVISTHIIVVAGGSAVVVGVASIREQALTLACLLAHACVRSNVASAASATYLWHFHTQYGENRVDVASGVCENNAHPTRARYSSAFPPSPPISMLRMMRVMFGLRKKRSLLREEASSRMPQL